MTTASNPVLAIARNELLKLLTHPFTYLIFIILVCIVLLNSMDNSLRTSIDSVMTTDDLFLYDGVSNTTYIFTFLCSIMAVFIGAMSLSSERSKKSIGLLLTKPVYRRDVIAGKFFGLSAFMFLFIVAYVIVDTLLITWYFRPPLDINDYLLRSLSYILLHCCLCSILIALMFLVSIIFKDVLMVALISVVYLFLEWFSSLLVSFDELKYFSPLSLYDTASYHLLYTSTAFDSWLQIAMPYALLMVLETIVLLLVDSFIFIRTEDI